MPETPAAPVEIPTPEQMAVIFNQKTVEVMGLFLKPLLQLLDTTKFGCVEGACAVRNLDRS